MKRASLALAVILSLLVPRAAWAQEPDAEARARAAEHFDRGIQFFNERRYDAALAELARAYELAPAHQTLYNLARVHAALGHAVDAARTYEQYLTEGGDELDARRRREAERALEEQRARIGTLAVACDVAGATIAIDGVDVATTPLVEPLRLSAGAHVVEVHAPGRESVRRAVAIAGRAETQIDVELREEVVPRGALRVTSSLPETLVLVDGEEVGLTPLSSTLPLRAGPHRVTARRLGYREETRPIEIDEGAEAELHFELRREPAAPPQHLGRLLLRLPDAPSLVRVDGEAMLGMNVELPIGAHHLVIEVTDRRPYQGTIRIESATGTEVAPALTWTLEARNERREAASEQRSIGIVLTAVGGATALGMAALLVWNETEIARDDDRLRFINAQLDGPRCMPFDDECAALEAEGRSLQSSQDSQNVLRGVSIAGTVLGVALAGTGLALWTTAPNDEAIDAAASAQLRVLPGGLALDGRF
ncbi:MAG: PEGA domain-containing protein [Myxococcales bacterium]|nr:PEGA domain-containing protein [Myxococcales bacterium]